MKGNRAVFTAIVILLVVIAGWWLLRRSGGGGAVDLLTQFDAADKRPAGDAFSIVDATLNGDSKKAISTPGGSGTRIAWKLRIPNDGWLKVDLGLKPEAWDKEGDGVKFLVLASDGKASEELFSQIVNPFGNQADRRWIPVMVDLSAYGSEEIYLIFNTYASPPNKGVDDRNDLPLWGAPEIVIR